MTDTNYFKRIFLFVVTTVLIINVFSSCKNDNKPVNTTQAVTSSTVSQNEEDNAVDEANRALIATALSIEPDSRNIKFILNTLRTINSGKIQKAELSEDNNEKVLKIVAENGTPFSVYLTNSGSVEAVKNNKTGEWIIKSER